MIRVKGKVVECLGDEMMAVIWEKIKHKLILPYVEFGKNLQVFDLTLENRIIWGDDLVLDAAKAIKEAGVGIKCATITPDEQKCKEIGTHLRSPNHIIREYLGGVIFREPVICENIPRIIKSWVNPIYIARHAYAGNKDELEMSIRTKSQVKLVQIDLETGYQTEKIVAEDTEHGVIAASFIEDDAVRSFARMTMNFAVEKCLPLYLSTKNTILKNYDGLYQNIFEKIYESEFKSEFEERGIFYKFVLTDAMVAKAMKSTGGFIWAMKNYDGDVQSDFVAQGFGSLGLTSSYLMTGNQKIIQTEACHGTVRNHFRKFLRGEPTSTNPIASIFAWTKGLAHRGKLDKNEELVQFSTTLEKVCVATIESGSMTKDLAVAVKEKNDEMVTENDYLTTFEFLDKIAENLRACMIHSKKNI